jgi:hypothetical protein
VAQDEPQSLAFLRPPCSWGISHALDLGYRYRVLPSGILHASAEHPSANLEAQLKMKTLLRFNKNKFQNQVVFGMCFHKPGLLGVGVDDSLMIY